MVIFHSYVSLPEGNAWKDNFQNMRLESTVPRMKADVYPMNGLTKSGFSTSKKSLLFRHVCPPNFRPISLSASWGSSSNAVLRCFEVYHNLPKDSTPSLTKLGSVSSGRQIGTHTGLWLVLRQCVYIDRHQNVSTFISYPTSYLTYIYIYIYFNFTHGKTCLDLPKWPRKSTEHIPKNLIPQYISMVK